MLSFSLIIFQSWFPPGSYDPQYKAWKCKNIIQLVDFTKNNKILEKGEIEGKLGDRLPWYACFQLRRMFDSIHFEELLKRPLTELKIILRKLKESSRKATFLFYNF